MGFLTILLIIIFAASALLLIGLVMLQDEGGDGLGGIFGGGGTTQVGNRSGNILTKTTSILGAVFLVSSFFLAFLNRTPDAGDIVSAAARLDSSEEVVEWWDVDEEGDTDADLQLPGGLLESLEGDGEDEGLIPQSGTGGTSEEAAGSDSSGGDDAQGEPGPEGAGPEGEGAAAE